MDTDVAENLDTLLSQALRGYFHFGRGDLVKQTDFYRLMTPDFEGILVETLEDVGAYFLALASIRTDYKAHFKSYQEIADLMRSVL